MILRNDIIAKLADVIMSEDIEWEQPDTCDKLQEAMRKLLSPTEAGILIGVYWDEYVNAALEYIKSVIYN
jgi:hypothetical protein